MNKSDILLSICIPTYNRAHTIYNLLSSIETELNKLEYKNIVEVVITDNASIDNTLNVVNNFILRGMNITYLCHNKNLGFGLNLTKAIDISHGKFCWMMGSDEVIFPGALFYVISIISDCSSDIIVGNPVSKGCTRKFFLNDYINYKLDSREKIISYIDNCTEISGFFAFISTIILKKCVWDSVKINYDLVSHPYTHQLRLLTFIAGQKASITAINQRLVISGEEINEWNVKLFNHFMLDCETLFYICNDIFSGDNCIKNSISKLVMRQYTPLRVLLCRCTTNTEKWRNLTPKLEYFKINKWLRIKKRYDFLLYIAYRIIKLLKRKFLVLVSS